VSKTNLVFSYADATPLTELFHCRKSIRFSEEDFCIALHTPDGIVHLLQRFVFPLSLTMLQKVIWVQEADEQLNVKCKEHVFMLHTALHTQIPQHLYHEKDDRLVGQYVSEKNNLRLVKEWIQPFGCVNLSFIEENDYNVITSHFINYQFSTSISGLLAVCHTTPSCERGLIFVGCNNFLIMAVSENKLLGINSFDYQTEDDFVYFALAFLQQMFKNPSEIRLSFSGNLTVDSSVCRSLSKFFKNFDFINFANQNDKIENSYYYADFLPLLKLML
jgi:hypothetical protein